MADLRNGHEGENDEAFERDLRRGLQAIGAHRGACLDDDTLLRLLRGGLPASEMTRARAHIAACGLCELRLSTLESIVAPPHSVFRRLWFRSRRFVAQPALAYLLVLALAVPAARQIWPRNPSPTGARSVPPEPLLFSVTMPVKPVIESIQVVSLSRERGNHAIPVVPAIGPGDRFYLAFYQPEVSGHHYLAQVVSQKGEVTPVTSLPQSDGYGNFSLSCARERFPPGSYTLKVWDAARTGADGNEYSFDVR